MTALLELAGLLTFAFTLGALTFFAPCAYPLLPGYVAYYLGTADGERSRRGRILAASYVGLLASAGFFLVYLALGGIVLAVGSSVLANVILLEAVVAVLLIGLGTAMAAGRSPSLSVALPERRRSSSGFFLFGVGYAAAAAGCTAPIFVLVVASTLTVDPALGAAMLVAYAAGMSVLMVAVTVLAGLGRGAILRRLSGRTGRIERAAGVLLVLAGVAQLYFFVFRFDGLAALGF